MNRQFGVPSKRLVESVLTSTFRFQAYSNLLKGNLYGLKKRDKKKGGAKGTGSGKATQ